MLISDPSHPIYYRVAPAILLPIAVLIANFGWTPPGSDYVGDLATWVIFAFLLGVAMWHQDRINQSFSTHWMFLPIIGLFNGFTFGLAMVLVLAGSISPDASIMIFFVSGILWGAFAVQKVSVYSDGLPLDEGKLKKTLSFLVLTCGCFVLTAIGSLEAGLGGALGFQFLIMLPIYEAMPLNAQEERLRKGAYFAGCLLLIGNSYFS